MTAADEDAVSRPHRVDDGPSRDRVPGCVNSPNSQCSRYSVPMSQPAAQDEDLLESLDRRAGRETVVVLRDGRRLTVYDIAWGYDMGDAWAHVTTNVSPGFEEVSVDFFLTSEVAFVIDPSSDQVIYGTNASPVT